MGNNVPIGFITIQEAIELINSDTRSNPVVDIKRLVQNLPYLKVNNNFNIWLLKRDETGRIVKNGAKPVQIADDWGYANLKHAITEHYKNASGRADFDPDTVGLISVTTTKEDDVPAGKLRVNKKPMVKKGDTITASDRVVNE